MGSALRWLLRGFIPVVILALAAGIAWLLWATRPEVPAEPAEERSWPVAAVTVDPGSHRPLLRLQGFLESPRTATLTAAVNADVAAVTAREGNTVAAGDPLVHLDERELRLALEQRRAEVAELAAQRRVEQRRAEADRQELAWEEELLGLLEREVARLEDLSREQFASPADLERSQQERTRQRLSVAERRFAVETAEDRLAQLDARLQRARAARDRAELDLARARVEAPYDARIASVAVAPGDRVAPGEPLLTLYDRQALEIRATVPQHALGALRRARRGAGVEASAEVDGQRVPVRLSRFGGRAERGQGGVDALFRITGDDHELVLGRFASLEVRLPPEPDTVVLPFEALYDANRVYRIRDGRMQPVAVERIGQVRRANGERGVLVRAPELASGERVVSTQIPQAMDGLRVRVTEQGTPDE